MENTSLQTALLIMDVQAGIIDRVADKEVYLADVQKTIDTAHQNDIPVFLIAVGFRTQGPEVSANNKMFGSMTTTIPITFLDPKPLILPTKNDVVVIKRRVSAFSGSDLEILLRAKNIKHLVLAGISTSGVVLSTTCEAADKDYQITVLEDLCTDADPEVHLALTKKILLRHANVISNESWRQQLSK